MSSCPPEVTETSSDVRPSKLPRRLLTLCIASAGNLNVKRHAESSGSGDGARAIVNKRKLTDLTEANVKDWLQVRRTLAQMDGFDPDRCWFVHDTADNRYSTVQIKSVIQLVMKRTGPGEEMLLLFMGHGHRRTGDWCFTAPIRLADLSDARVHVVDTITRKEVLGLYSRAFEGRHLTIISDCCYSGHWTQSTEPGYLSAPQEWRPTYHKARVGIFATCLAEEKAYAGRFPRMGLKLSQAETGITFVRLSALLQPIPTTLTTQPTQTPNMTVIWIKKPSQQDEATPEEESESSPSHESSLAVKEDGQQLDSDKTLAHDLDENIFRL
eukprot:scpid83562/ scgid26571/ 